MSVPVPAPTQLYPDARPWTRWWWFAGPLQEEEIEAQLRWVAASGFGGVELAFAYPLPGTTTGPRFLSHDWTRLVTHTRRRARQLGLGCDLTFGTMWPLGGTMVTPADASRTHDGTLHPMRTSWESLHGSPGLILNHLDRRALERYGDVMGQALAPALREGPGAIFCDSWEVPTEGLWSHGLDAAFRERFGYDLRAFELRIREHPDVRYDQRRLLAEQVLHQFHEPLAEICHRLGAAARVQCHGAPTDLLAAYAAMDVPETEALLFDPPFAQLAASAATLRDRPVVSAETFTCLYGWKPYPGPGPYQGQEQIADLKLVADALVANGVNLLVWHGMPYNPPGGTNRFYATTHVGPDSPLAPELPAFNAYLERICGVMRRGRNLGQVAVYLPVEDLWREDELPSELRRPSARYHWEMQYVRFPEALRGYRPTWVSSHFLFEGEVQDGVWHCGPASFSLLHVEARWLDAVTLQGLLRLARAGLPICLHQRPRQPGHVPDALYEQDLERLLALPGVDADLQRLLPHPPLLEGEQLPDFWVRREQEVTWIFLAHPRCRLVSFPLRHGEGRMTETVHRTVTLRLDGHELQETLTFPPGQSLLLRLEPDGHLVQEDILYLPPGVDPAG